MNKMQEAINILKSLSKADGEEGTFRGGDPEWLQQKKEDKEEEQAAQGDLVSQAIQVLKGEPGAEEGTFRGGDPELLQQKREEKRQEALEQGGGDDDGGADEPDPADVEEAQLKAQDKEEAAGKALPFGGPDIGQQVSPVDTLEDYRPRDNNGDPLDTNQKYPDQENIEVCPPRQGPNQWKPWSEVLGFKVPPEGAPWQHLRRYVLSGESPETVTKEANMLARSLAVDLIKGLDQFPEYEQEAHDAFFNLYDGMNRGLTWDPHHLIFKAREGEVVPGHKYVYRWMGDAGKWEYEYSGGQHKDNHGIQHTGNRQGHTVEVHPEFEAKGLDPSHTNPEAAFHFARGKAMEQKGQYPLMVHNPDTMQMEQKLLRINPGKDKPLSLVNHPESGLPQGKPNRFDGFEGLEEHVRKNHVNTEYDIHGKPWIQWMAVKPGDKSALGEFEPKPFEEVEGESPKKREKRFSSHTEKEEKRKAKHKEMLESARIKMRYHPDTPYPGSIPKKRDDRGFFQGSSSEKALKRRVAVERGDQYRAAGIFPQKAPKFEVIDDKPYTNMVHAGLPRKRETVPYQRTVSFRDEKGKTASEKRDLTGSRKVWTVDWESPKHRDEVLQGLMREHKGLAIATASKLANEASNKYQARGMQALPKDVKDGIVSDLTDLPYTAAITRAVRTYDPHNSNGASFPSYLHTILRGEQRGALENSIRDRRAGLGGATTSDEKTHRLMDAHLADTADAQDEEQFPEWLNRARKHVDGAYDNWLNANSNTASDEDFADMLDQHEFAHDTLSELEGMHKKDPDSVDPHLYYKKANEYHLHPMFHVPGPDSPSADAISDSWSQPSPSPSAKKPPAPISRAEALEKDYGPIVHKKLKDIGLKHPEWNQRIKSEGMHEGNVGDLLFSMTMNPLHESLPPEIVDDMGKELMGKLVQHGYKPPSKVAKAIGDQEQADQPPMPDVNYVGMQGEPGALKFFYEAGPGGNIVQGTNAPDGHEDHVPGLGAPQMHENEPTPDTHPDLFDEQGRKLDRPVPPDAEVEDNPDYNPDKSQGNSWVKRYADPNSGDMQYIYLHRDHALDPKMKNNLAMKYLDVQLPKIRGWYQSMMLSGDPSSRALGLFVALMDQGGMSHPSLTSLKVGDVSVDGNTAKIGSVKVVLDPTSKQVLEELMEGKEPDQPLFQIDDNVLDTTAINRFFHDKFGVLPSAFQIYRVTKDFTQLFQDLVAKNKAKGAPASYLMANKDQILYKLAEDYGMTPEQLSVILDPITLEAAMLSAHLQGLSKSTAHPLQDKYVFQGLPISIENKKGSTREWYDPHDKRTGHTKMHFDYGYIRRTKGVDGDQVDVYIGPDKDADMAFVIHQMKAPEFKKYDEDKVMLGFSSEAEAKQAYLKQYDNPKFFGSCTPISMDEFKKKVFSSNSKMIKAQMRTISVDVPMRSADEEQFSQWLHSYPVHEHEMHWQGFSGQHSREQDDESRLQQMKQNRPQGIDHFTVAEAGAAQ